MVRRTASDDQALEYSRMICGSEEACRSADVWRDHMGSIEPEASMMRRTNSPAVSGVLASARNSRKAEWRQVYGDERAKSGQHIPGWKEGQDAFGQRAKQAGSDRRPSCR